MRKELAEKMKQTQTKCERYTDYRSSGNKSVDELRDLTPQGNVLPWSWFKELPYEDPDERRKVKSRPRPYLAAILILGELLWWHRPDEGKAQDKLDCIKLKRKFTGTKLELSTRALAEYFGLSMIQCQRALRYLVKKNLIKIYREVSRIKSTGTFEWRQYIDVNSREILAITYNVFPRKHHASPV